jgi:2-polyprenyl-3-methyl-5-hydroxy-6-metoxy-1,4-benzoquinol methylase
MGDYTIEDIRRKVQDLSRDQEWNHFYDLKGVRTRSQHVNSPGYNTAKWKRLEPILSKIIDEEINSVLDVGCSDGYYSIELAKLHKNIAVTGIDLDDLRIQRCKFVKKIFQIQNSSFKTADLYDLMSSKKTHDIVMGLGLLHRVPDLEQCIRDLCSMANKFVVFEFKTLKTSEPSFLHKGGETKSNCLNGLYKIPSISYVKNEMAIHGFSSYIAVEDDNSDLKYPRTIMVGKNESSI